ncbi:hypothetical protein GCM10011390_43080 [Aureimonas endophytica]|uniref:SpoVT-AbrB domain-containing protein n=1 Tax=Aureimonas endophytica TaxID=2027858 RepID=A0A917ECF1_9HYPH|nr:AbrB/MazE/SpoVT family DNA-binding domain-containing protein [Aureimonas endophytica]GGE19247.1 hypothetical protein GCM10011390_43080 [Aureimonas endophytica]
MIGAVKKFGNSAGILIPKPILAQIGARAGDKVDMRIEGNRIVIERVVAAPRAGWAEDAESLAAEELDSDWLDLPGEEDDSQPW